MGFEGDRFENLWVMHSSEEGNYLRDNHRVLRRPLLGVVR